MTTILLGFLSFMYFATPSSVRLSRVWVGTSSSTGTEDSLPILPRPRLPAPGFWCRSLRRRPMMTILGGSPVDDVPKLIQAQFVKALIAARLYIQQIIPR